MIRMVKQIGILSILKGDTDRCSRASICRDNGHLLRWNLYQWVRPLDNCRLIVSGHSWVKAMSRASILKGPVGALESKLSSNSSWGVEVESKFELRTYRYYSRAVIKHTLFLFSNGCSDPHPWVSSKFWALPHERGAMRVSAEAAGVGTKSNVRSPTASKLNLWRLNRPVSPAGKTAQGQVC